MTQQQMAFELGAVDARVYGILEIVESWQRGDNLALQSHADQIRTLLDGVVDELDKIKKHVQDVEPLKKTTGAQSFKKSLQNNPQAKPVDYGKENNRKGTHNKGP